MVRAATTCRALWAAAAGPLTRVRRLSATISSESPDLSAEELTALLRRFPSICELQCKQGSWQFTGLLHTLPALARQLSSLQADHTALPLLRPAPTTTRGGPLRLTALRHLQLRSIVTAAAARAVGLHRQSTQGGSSPPPDSLLAQLLAHSPGLTSLDLADNTGLPDAALSAALRGMVARTSLRQLSLASASSLRRPGSCVASTLGGGQLLDLDLSNTALDDCQLRGVVYACTALTRLSINDCKQVYCERVCFACMRQMQTSCVGVKKGAGYTSGFLNALCRPVACWTNQTCLACG